MSPALAHAVEQSQVMALHRLVSIMTTSKSDHESRLAAEAILKFKPVLAQSVGRSTAAPPPSPASVARPDPCMPDLSAEELNDLRMLLPHIRPDRFKRPGRAAYWRTLLQQRSGASGPPLRAAG